MHNAQSTKNTFSKTIANAFFYIVSYYIVFTPIKTKLSHMSTSIGYSSAMSGVTRNPNSFVSPNSQPSNLGGGYNGYSPALLGGGAGTHGGSGMEGGNERSMDRLLLRQAWNGQYASGDVNGRKPVTTPFRLVNNAGDYLGRQNYVSGGSDQVQGRVRSSATGAWRMFAGHVQATNDGTGIPSSTCNVK
jgi:hypothetical protein